MGVVGAINMTASSDPRLMAGELSVGITLSLLQIIPAFLGLLLSYWSLKQPDNPPRLYLNICKYFSYLWLMFIPIGTIIGFKQLKLINTT